MLNLACFLKFNKALPADIILLEDKSIRLPYKIITIQNVDSVISEK